jgi:hypothetical protein
MTDKITENTKISDLSQPMQRVIVCLHGLEATGFTGIAEVEFMEGIPTRSVKKHEKAYLDVLPLKV